MRIPRALPALLAIALSATAQGVHPPATRADIDVGRGTFRIYCSACHGIDAAGGRGPDLTRGVYQAGDGDEDLRLVIANGVSGTEMPGYGTRLSQDSIWRLVAYIRAVAQPDRGAPSGDAVAGRALYKGKGACAACHAIGDAGGALGPNLSRIGRSRSLAHLRRSLVEPDAELTPGFATVEVETRDGKVLRGIEKNFDNFYVAFVDLGATYRSFERSALARSERPARSLMPSYADAFSARELDDLVAYLASLGGGENAR